MQIRMKDKFKDKKKPKFEAKPEPVSSTGEVGLKFTSKALVSKLPKDAIQAKFKADGDAKAKTARKLSEAGEPADDDDDSNFTFEVTGFDENGLQFKMGFKDPLKVSQNNKS